MSDLTEAVLLVAGAIAAVGLFSWLLVWIVER